MPILDLNTKAVAILHSFDRKEIGRCRKFLQAEYFNNNPLLLSTFNCLHQKRDRIKVGKFTRQHLYQQLKTKHRADKIDVTDLLSRLREQLETFLVQCELNDDPCRKKQLLLKSLTKRNLSTQFAKQVESTTAILQKSKYRDGYHFWNTFELRHRQFNHPEFSGTGKAGEKISLDIPEMNLNPKSIVVQQDAIQILLNAQGNAKLRLDRLWKNVETQFIASLYYCIRFKKMEDIPYDLIAELCTKMTPQEWIDLYEKNIKNK